MHAIGSHAWPGFTRSNIRNLNSMEKLQNFVQKQEMYLRCFDMIYDDNGKSSGLPERNAIGHTHDRLKRTCVGSNGILECNILSENAHRTKD
jgi:hypothetical protein